MLTPEQIAELKVLMEKATPLPHTVHRYDHGGGRVLIDEPKGTRKLIADFYHEEDREWWLALVNAAPALLAAAERDAGMCPMLDAEPDRVIVTGLAHGGCRLRHALEVRADATFDPRSLYVRSARVAELEAALEVERIKVNTAEHFVRATASAAEAEAASWGERARLAEGKGDELQTELARTQAALAKEKERAERWKGLAREFVEHNECWKSSRSCTGIHRDAYRAALSAEEGA